MKKPTSMISDFQRARAKKDAAFKRVSDNRVKAKWGHEEPLTLKESMSYVKEQAKDFHEISKKIK